MTERQNPSHDAGAQSAPVERRASSLASRSDTAEQIAVALFRTAAGVLQVCAVDPTERIVLLTDEATANPILEAFLGALADLTPASDPVVIVIRPRRPAFSDIPSQALAALLGANLAIDLTSEPWLYSDSFTRFGQECGRTGTRLALVWGGADSLRTIAACPPSALLAARARRGLIALERARTLRVRSHHGSDFVAELGDPANHPRSFIGEPPARRGAIGAPLCASVTAPFVPGTAAGTLAFVGSGRFQGPENRPLRAVRPVEIGIEAGHVVRVDGDHAVAISLADWFTSAGDDNGRVLMDCNIGFDPRATLRWADNTVVHSYAGGVMIGIANPYEYLPQGSRRPGYHLDLMLPGADVDLDDLPFIRGGQFTPESGVL